MICISYKNVGSRFIVNRDKGLTYISAYKFASQSVMKKFSKKEIKIPPSRIFYAINPPNFDYFNTRPSFSNSQIVTPTTNNPTRLGKRRRIQCLRSCSRIHARERRRRGGDKEKKEEDCVTRVARGIENGRKLVDASQNKGKPPNETEIRISKRGIASMYTSIVRRSVRRGFNQEISGTR